MSSHNNNRSECRIYVGNLPPDIRTKDIQDLFHKFGKVSFVDLKNRRGPPFSFVEFEDARDAEDAVKARDGYDYDGYRLRVEFPRGSGPGSFRGNRNSDRGGGGGGGGGGGEGGRGGGGGGGGGRDGGNRNRGPPTKRSQFRVLVSGLPPSGSWQDLKDHMREAGDVCFADVYKDGSGVVEFLRHEDMKYAIKKLDDSRFRSHERGDKGSSSKQQHGEVAYIRVKEDTGEERREYRDRYPNPSTKSSSHNNDSSNNLNRPNYRSRSRSYSPRRRRGTPTYSPVRRSFSRSRSDSRSNY